MTMCTARVSTATADVEPYLVFDVGGTTLRAGLYDPVADALVANVSGPTASRWADPNAGLDELVERLVVDLHALACSLGAPRDPVAIAIGFPGPIDREGRVVAAPTILGAAPQPRLPVAQLLARRWSDTRILVTNDVTAAGLALLAHSRDDLCAVTVSSNIGMKLFVGGQPLLGPSGTGGEIGHLVVDHDPGANRCECGGRGHLGAIASGRGALATARRRAGENPSRYAMSALGATKPEALDTYGLAHAFHAGDAWVVEIIAHGARALGRALATVHTATGVERIVLLGGFATALGEAYRRLVAAAAAECCWDIGPPWHEMLELRDLDGQAGLLGAGRYARTVRTT